MTADRPNPIQAQKFLGGVDYPVGRDDLVRTAERSGADDRLLDALRSLPDRKYSGPNAVSAALSEE